MSATQGPHLQPQQTVQVRVQVIDLKSVTLDLQVPTYLPARDLTHRIAQDAGLGAFWEDGRRRLYWLRARGCLLREDETLGDLGVINGELVYLLPEPPQGSGVVEQRPDYPENKGYAGKGIGVLLGSTLGVVVWAVAWGVALTVERSTATVMLPGLAMGLFCLSLARHLWGGRGDSLRIPAVAVVLFILVSVMAFLPGVIKGEAVATVYSESISGLIMGMVGVFFGWLAWWGAVEPLPETAAEEAIAQQSVVEVPCGICGLGVVPDVRQDCVHACGQTFHTGCYQARLAVYRGDARFCAVCNRRVG
jgi:uncharacterized ubiquitin-like protein YukD